MRFIAAIDTVIYGHRYAQGAEIDITNWSRKQILQFLGLGLMQASQITAGMIQDALIFSGAGVTTSTDVNGRLNVNIEFTPQDIDWLLDVDTSTNPPTDGMVLGYDGTAKQWVPKALGIINTYAGLSDVDLTGLADGQIPIWHADTHKWKPGAPPSTKLSQLTDVDTTTNPAIDGDALVWDNSEGRWRPGTASAVPGPAGPVTWATPEPWSSTKAYIMGPPASVVTYQGSAYVAIANTTGVVPTNTAGWRLIVAQGLQGPTGQTGPASTVPGPPGPANTLTIGTVGTAIDPTPASATITGTAPNQVLNLVIPKGQNGNPGPQGPPGKAIPAGGTLSVLGPIQTAVGVLRLYNDTGSALTISLVRLAVGTAPGGQPIIVNVNKDGASIFTTNALPQIAVGANTGVATPNVTAWANGSYLTVDVTQIGSGTTPGADLTVTVVAG